MNAYQTAVKAATQKALRAAAVVNDGEKCFDLDRFLSTLEYEVETLCAEGETSAHARCVALHIWAELQGADDTPYTFRGFPILD